MMLPPVKLYLTLLPDLPVRIRLALFCFAFKMYVLIMIFLFFIAAAEPRPAVKLLIFDGRNDVAA